MAMLTCSACGASLTHGGARRRDGVYCLECVSKLGPEPNYDLVHAALNAARKTPTQMDILSIRDSVEKSEETVRRIEKEVRFLRNVVIVAATLLVLLMAMAVALLRSRF